MINANEALRLALGAIEYLSRHGLPRLEDWDSVKVQNPTSEDGVVKTSQHVERTRPLTT